MARTEFYNRVGYVIIYDYNGNPLKLGVESGDGVESNLDFKFNVRKIEGCEDRQQQATIDILGLKKETIDKIVYWGPRTTPRDMLKRVEVYAGYEDVGADLIFTGYIFNASVSELPDMWLHIQSDNLIMDGNAYTCSIKGGTIKSICNDVAKHFGLTLRWDKSLDEIDKKFPDTHPFVCNNTQLNQTILQIRKLDTSNRMYVFAENKTLNVIDVAKEKKQLELSVETGLIKIDQVGFQTSAGLGIVATARLDTIWQPGNDIKIKSQLLPCVNDTWHIYEVSYIGHFRGNEWNVKLSGFATEENLKRHNRQLKNTW